MQKQTLFFTKDQLREIIKRYPTPFHIYNGAGIRKTVKELNKAFSWAPGFKEYFSVKALPNPYILKILKEEGCGLECGSLPELFLSESVGIVGEDIMFNSNYASIKEYEKAEELGAIINLDDITHIPFFEELGIPKIACFRYNPGSLRKGNFIIGNPEEAKYGLTKKQLFKAYQIMRDKGVKRFGLHTMLASNESNPDYFIETAKMLFDIVVEISKELGIRFEFINMGGGIGIPDKPNDKPVDINRISEGIKEAYDEKIREKGLHPLKIFMENGRMVTGPHGFLITKVINEKNIYKTYIGVDACMANLMRPGMYGAYHHITVIGKEDNSHNHKYDVVGSLCENNDKFAIDRFLPKIEIGDILAIHNSGAHGHSMGFNYNGKLKSAELLLKEDGTVEMIRRAEEIKDYFSTLNFSGLK